MKRKVVLVSALILALILGLPLVYVVAKNRMAEAEFSHQADMARKEGLPTTHAEFVGMLPKLDSADNAAELYRQLPNYHKLGSHPDVEIEACVSGLPTPSNLAKAKALVAAETKALNLLEQASNRWHCQSDIEFREDIAHVTPVAANIRSWSSVSLARGSYYAASKLPIEAIKDARLAFRIAEHLGEAPYWPAVRWRIVLEEEVLRHLAMWALNHPEEPAYREEISRFIRDYKPIDLQKAWRYGAVMSLDVLKLCQTESGRAYLGLKRDDVEMNERLFQRFKSTIRAKTRILELLRDHQKAAAGQPASLMQEDSRITKEMGRALEPFRSADRVINSLLSIRQTDATFIYGPQMRNTAFRAFLRATESGRVAKTIRTDDLLSPVSRKPVIYKWDGRTFEIQLDPGNGVPPYELRVERFK